MEVERERLIKQYETAKELQAEYNGQTINSIINQLKSRIEYYEHQQS